MSFKAGQRRGLRIALLAGVATLLLGGSAKAATVTVGSSLGAAFAQTPNADNATLANFVLPSPANATSPTDGTVISWRFVGAGGTFAPRVLTPSSGTTHSGSGTGTAVMPSAVPPAISGPYTTSLPIKRGNRFGVDVASGSTIGTAPTPGATYLQWVPPLPNGSSQAPTASIAAELAIEATVRFCKVPALKGMTGKAARQALSSADCTLGNVTKSRKKRPTKQVLSQTVKANRSIADTEPVGFTVSQKRKIRSKPRNKCKKIRNKKKRKRCNKKRKRR
jgi:hypothetical protein